MIAWLLLAERSGESDFADVPASKKNTRNTRHPVPCLASQKSTRSKWVFPKFGVSHNGWFIMEKPTKMDDLGVPLFSETSKHVLSFFLQMTSFKSHEIYIP